MSITSLTHYSSYISDRSRRLLLNINRPSPGSSSCAHRKQITPLKADDKRRTGGSFLQSQAFVQPVRSDKPTLKSGEGTRRTQHPSNRVPFSSLLDTDLLGMCILGTHIEVQSRGTARRGPKTHSCLELVPHH